KETLAPRLPPRTTAKSQTTSGAPAGSRPLLSAVSAPVSFEMPIEVDEDFDEDETVAIDTSQPVDRRFRQQRRHSLGPKAPTSTTRIVEARLRFLLREESNWISVYLEPIKTETTSGYHGLPETPNVSLVERLKMHEWEAILEWVEHALTALGYKYNDVDQVLMEALTDEYQVNSYEFNRTILEFITLANEMIKMKQPTSERVNPRGRRLNVHHNEPTVKTKSVTWDNLKTVLADNNRLMMEAMVKAIQASKSPKRNRLQRQNNQGDDSDYDSGGAIESGDDDDEDNETKPRKPLHRGIHLLNMESIPVFNGAKDGRDKAHQWIRKFSEIGRMAGWNDKEIMANFEIYVGKSVRSWYLQLKPEAKSSWEFLRQRFISRWAVPQMSKEDKYHQMVQEQGEEVMEFFFRFNHAARDCNYQYWKKGSKLNDHIRRFCTKLLDVELGKRIGGNIFKDIDKLEDYLDNKDRLNALFDSQNTKKKKEVSKPSVTPNIFAAQSIDFQAEVFALGRNGSSAQREHCLECNQEHYKTGHPDKECYKACQNCDPTHHKTREACPFKIKLKAIADYMANHESEMKPDTSFLKKFSKKLKTCIRLHFGLVVSHVIGDSFQLDCAKPPIAPDMKRNWMKENKKIKKNQKLHVSQETRKSKKNQEMRVKKTMKTKKNQEMHVRKTTKKSFTLEARQNARRQQKC
ncbi:unnamed protein product, partial [Aphanomyces euteiches]